jgi:hypothetical protein
VLYTSIVAGYLCFCFLIALFLPLHTLCAALPSCCSPSFLPPARRNPTTHAAPFSPDRALVTHAVVPPAQFILPHACVKGKSKKRERKQSKKRKVKKKERERNPGRGRPQIRRTHVGTDSDSIAPSLHPTSTTHRDRLGHLPRSHSPPFLHAVPVFHIQISFSFYRNTPVFSEKVCVVTCCFRSSVFILSVLRTPGKKKKTETKKGGNRKEVTFIWAYSAGRLGSLFSLLCFSFAPHTLAQLLHFVSSSFDYMFGTIIQPCIIV